MRIDKALNLVLPIERDDGVVLFAHSTPIEEATFLAYHRPLNMTYAQMDADGLIRSGGIRNADLILKEVSERIGVWKDDPQTKSVGVERGLLGEIRRLTNVFAPTGTKWEAVPLDECVNRDVLSAREAREVQAGAVYFTCASRNFPRQNLKEFLQICSGRIGAQVTYLNASEFNLSLPTLTAGENSGATAAAWWDKFSSPSPPATDSPKS
jgi:hypothetical protein